MASRTSGRICSLALVAAILVGGTATVQAEPSDRRLFFTGMALAPPDYLLGVAIHEGSHALVAKLAGATVTEVHLFPPGIDPKAHKFRFGWTYVHGLTGTTAHTLFYLAPKFTDLALLGGYTALAYSNGWPSGRYGQLALTVFATGLWVDFAKDVLLFAPQNDVSRALKSMCMTGWRQVPARLVYGAITVGLAVLVWHGYERTFERTLGDDDESQPRRDSDMHVMPMFSTAF